MAATLIRNGIVLQMTGGARHVVDTGAVLIDGNAIVAVGPVDELDADERSVDAVVVDATDHAVLPAFRFLQEGFEHEVIGIDELDQTIADYQSTWPEVITVRVEITTPIQSHHGIGRGGFVWTVGDDRSYGTDFAEVGDDGPMKTIVVFMDPPPRDQ